MSAGPHLDDDALSAHLDGYDAGAGDHLDGCAECRARLEALADAAAAIGAPPPPAPSHVVSAAVARAVDAEERRSRRPVLVALAAAVVVVLGIVGVTAIGDDERPSESDTAASADAEGDDSFASGAATAGDSAVAFGGDLGELDDPTALSTRVRAVVEPAPRTESGDGGSGEAEDNTVGEAVPSAALGAKSGRATTTTGTDPYCERAVARELDQGLGGLVYRATLTWDGTKAVALAYSLAEPKGELDHRLYVLATGSCQLLVAQTF